MENTRRHCPLEQSIEGGWARVGPFRETGTVPDNSASTLMCVGVFWTSLPTSPLGSSGSWLWPEYSISDKLLNDAGAAALTMSHRGLWQ